MSFSAYSKTFTSRFLGVQRRDNLKVILLGQDGSFLTEPENQDEEKKREQGK